MLLCSIIILVPLGPHRTLDTPDFSFTNGKICPTCEGYCKVQREEGGGVLTEQNERQPLHSKTSAPNSHTQDNT